MQKTVLVIDDDEVALFELRNILEDSGYRVLATADGPQGLMLFRDQHPDAVILDLGLPSMSGVEVLGQIFEIDSCARVLVLTGYASPALNERTRSLGAAAFFSKPIDPPDLLEKLSAMVGV